MKHPGIRNIPLIMLLIMLMCGAYQTGRKSSPVLIQDLDESVSLSGIESFHQIYHQYPSPGEMLSVIDMEDKYLEPLGLGFDVLARGSSEEEIKDNIGCLALLIQYKNYPNKKVKIQM